MDAVNCAINLYTCLREVYIQINEASDDAGNGHNLTAILGVEAAIREHYWAREWLGRLTSTLS